MTLEQLMNLEPSDQFAIVATHDEIYWFDFGWYISPKKALAAYKSRSYSKDLKSFKNVKILHRKISSVTSDVTSSHLI